jgi:hypothetical protein
MRDPEPSLAENRFDTKMVNLVSGFQGEAVGFHIRSGCYQQKTPPFKRNAGAPRQFSVFREAGRSRLNWQTSLENELLLQHLTVRLIGERD